jgi:signal transduction histidine kinase
MYARIARANAMLRRERDNKLMNLEAVAAAISHELKQPLTAIALNSDTALESLEHSPLDLKEMRANLSDVVVDSRRANETLDGLRVLFLKSAREQEVVDLNEAALDALRILRGDLRDHDVKTRAQLVDQPFVIGQKSQMREVFINLFHNAIEAMDATHVSERVLKVSTAYDGAKAIIVDVEDSGPGIDAKMADSLFDAFATTKPGGMGLGLAICRMIVDRHNGELSARPAYPHGTIFRIVLPRDKSGD